MEKADTIVRKIVKKRVVGIELVRAAREDGKQDIAYNSRPFVLCGLPLRRPPKNQLIHERKNGKFFLQVVGHPEHGLPFGQDRLIPIWIASLAVRQNSRVVRFRSAAEVLREFGLPNNGVSYRRLMQGFRRIFASSMFFGNEKHRAEILLWSRFHYFDNIQLWFAKNTEQPTLEGEEFENVIRLSELFWEELQEHPIPVDMNVVRELAAAPGILDLYMWLTWRCWVARGQVNIPLFGENGLSTQLGMVEQRPKLFRLTLKRWLKRIRLLWLECPAHLSEDGECLIVDHAEAILPMPTSSTIL